MKRLFCAIIFLTTLSNQAQERNIPKDQPITWVFLNAGSARSKTKSMPQEEVGKMQAAHLGNFSTQFNRGTLMAAGPVGDNVLIRGTVILSVQTPEQVADCFKTDPFVQNDILAVEAHPWLVDVMKFGTPKIPFQITRHTLCIIKKGKNWTPPKFEIAEDAMLR